MKVNHISDIMAEVLNARYIAVGSPTLNKTMMPTVASFLCYMRGLAPAGRVGIPFGSYGWAPMGPNDVYQALELRTCVNGRKVYGGPAAESVGKQIALIEEFINARK